MEYDAGRYDIIVVGAGHAGCEAGLAAARLGCRTLVLTLSLDYVALMPCNPAMGGPAKVPTGQGSGCSGGNGLEYGLYLHSDAASEYR